MTIDETPRPHPETTADVAIICVTHNSVDLVAAFVRTALQVCGDSPHRIVVVDSASTDGTPQAARGVSAAVDICVMASNRGYAAGINVGIDHVRKTGGADVFIVANPDVLFGAGSVASLVDALAQQDIGVSCPMIVDQHGVRDDSLSRLPNVWAGLVCALFGAGLSAALGLPVEVLRDESAYERAHAVGWACGGLLAISDECSARVGPWNEEYFMYEEEVDFCERVAQAGRLVWYVPDAVVTRAVSSDANAPWRHALSQINRIRREDRTGRGPLRRTQFIVENVLRLHRARSRAALWAIVTNATPGEVIRRYRAGTQIEVGPASPSTPAAYAVLAATEAPANSAVRRPGQPVGGGTR